MLGGIPVHPAQQLVADYQVNTARDMVGRVGLEPTKLKAPDLQSGVFAAILSTHYGDAGGI